MNVLLQSIATKIFSTVCFHMSPQTACPRRGKVTLVALVWLFSTVKKRWEILLQNIAPQFSCFACLYNITQHLDFLRKLNTSNQKDIALRFENIISPKFISKSFHFWTNFTKELCSACCCCFLSILYLENLFMTFSWIPKIYQIREGCKIKCPFSRPLLLRPPSSPLPPLRSAICDYRTQVSLVRSLCPDVRPSVRQWDTFV